VNVDLPANHIALAKMFLAISKGRPKPLKAHLADAEVAMAELRQQGFRIVPFPPLKTLEHDGRYNGRRAKATNRKKRGRKN